MGNATQGLNQATLKNLQSLLSQREAATGRPVDPRILESLFGADLQAQLQTSIQREQLAESSRRFEEQLTQRKEEFSTQTELTKQQLEQQEDAAKVSGAADVIGTLGTTYLGYKLLAGETAAAATTTGVTGLTSATGEAATGVGAIETAGGLEAGTTAGSAQAPTAVTGTEAGGGTSGVGFGIAAAVIADSMIANATVGGFQSFEQRQETNLQSLVGYGGLVTPGGAAVLQEAGVKTPAQVVEGAVGFDPSFGAVQDINEFLSAIPILDEISDVANDMGTIICTELNRQGFMSAELKRLSKKYRMGFIDINTYEGYLILARPIVRLMKKSRLVTHLIKPFALGYALEVAHCLRPKKYLKGSKLGKLVLKIGIPLCRKVGHNG